MEPVTLGMGIAGGLGAIGALFGGKSQADSAEKIAQAQLAQHREDIARQEANQRETREMAMKEAPATMEELMGQQMQLQQATRYASLIEARWLADADKLNVFNPNIMKMANNMGKMLDGEDAPMLKNIKRDRERQRNQLRQRLQQQMGPGYDQSSAGNEALNQFDTQTEDLMAQVQQQAMASTSNFLTQGMQTYLAMNAGQDSSVQTLGQLMGQYQGGLGSIQKRKIGAIMGTGIQSGGAASFAGADHVGQNLMGQTIGNMGNDMLKAGIGLMGNTGSPQTGNTPGLMPQPGIGKFWNQAGYYPQASPQAVPKYVLGDYTHGQGGYTA